MKKIRVKNATKQGYIEVMNGGGMSLAYPESKKRRGRVIEEGRISPTLDTGCNVGVIIVDENYKNRPPRFYKEYSPSLTGEVRGLEVMHICKEGKGTPKMICKPCLTPDRIEKRQQGRRFKEDGEEAFTVTSQDRHGVLLDDGTEIKIRRLTPRECFRLQGWTDDYFDRAQFINSDSQLYKQAGNGVTVNVIYEIGKALNNADSDN